MNNLEKYIEYANMIVPFMYFLAGVTITLLAFSRIYAGIISRKMNSNSEKEFKKISYYILEIPYTICITIISLFPLLGMLGTVLSLRGLDITGESDALKLNFFAALDTTIWGLVFSIGGKLINSLFQPYIESQIDKASKLIQKTY